jgi:hypothetical protein
MTLIWFLAATAYVTTAAAAGATFTAADHQARLRPAELLAAAIVGAAWPIFLTVWAIQALLDRPTRH